MMLAGAEVAEEAVHASERVGQVAAECVVDDLQPLAGVRVMECECALRRGGGGR
jgi:hypothetical protein